MISQTQGDPLTTTANTPPTRHPSGPPTPPGTRPLISISGLVKRYNGTPALNGLDMRVEGGSIYGFVGPNGAGKTTTMRILATLLEADEGSGLIAGEDVRAHPARVRARIGFMPDFFGVYEDLTAAEYLDFYAASCGVPGKRRRQVIDELLELIDLSHKRNEYVESLSRGMKQRLGLARALVHDPAVLLLDEPASGMDPRARYEMREIVKELRRLGKTVLISSHILLELAEMCTHIGIIQSGRLVREGPVDQILRGLDPGRAIEVRVLGSAALARAAIAALPQVTAVDPEVGGHPTPPTHHPSEAPGSPGTQAPEDLGTAPADETAPSTIVFRTFGGDAVLQELLHTLVAAGLPVIGFSVQRDNLEEVFMQITEQQLATPGGYPDPLVPGSPETPEGTCHS